MKKKLGIFALTVVFSLGLSFQSFAAYGIFIGRDFKDSTMYEASLNTLVPTAKAARHFANAGYDTTTFTSPTNNLLYDVNEYGDLYMCSDILYFNGEGSTDSVSWWETSKRLYKCGVIAHPRVTGDKNIYYNLTSNNFKHVKLAMFMACNTAPMADYAVSQGAKSALGFNYAVKASDMEKFSERVTLRLSRGDTLNEALTYAVELGGYVNSSIKSFNVKGGSNTVASPRSTSSNKGTIKVKTEDENGNIVTDEMYVDPYVETERMPEIYNLDKEKMEPILCTAENLSLEKISSYIKENIDSNFDINTYVVKSNIMPDSELGILLLDFKVGDFVSNSGYTVITENGYVKEIAQSGIIDYMIDVEEQKSDMSEEEMKADAIKKENLTNMYDVINQTVEKRIDTKTGRCYYIVFTEYENKETGGGRLTSQEYDIDAKIVEKAPVEAEPQSLEQETNQEQTDNEEATENEINSNKVMKEEIKEEENKNQLITNETNSNEEATENETEDEKTDEKVIDNEINEKKFP